MGQILCCCSRCFTSQPLIARGLPDRGGAPELNAEIDSSVPTTPLKHDHIILQRSQSAKLPSQNSLSIVNMNATCNPKLECIIVPSFGKDPPSNVVLKKASSDFLKGVGDDFKIIQDLIGKDQQKELGRVQLMCHFEQVKLADFTKMIKDRMQDLKLKRAENAENDRKGCKYNYYSYRLYSNITQVTQDLI